MALGQDVGEAVAAATVSGNSLRYGLLAAPFSFLRLAPAVLFFAAAFVFPVSLPVAGFAVAHDLTVSPPPPCAKALLAVLPVLFFLHRVRA